MRISPEQALEKLKRGLARSLSDNRKFGSGIDSTRRSELAQGQTPYAVILACADSRVSPEFIFDAGMGDLFVCRNAGNLVTNAVLDSIEYAALQLKTPLLLVLGHKECAAVQLTVKEARKPGAASQSIRSLIKLIMPAVKSTRPSNQSLNLKQTWTEKAIKVNVELACKEVLKHKPVLAQLISQKQFRICGAVYDTQNGDVEFLY